MFLTTAFFKIKQLFDYMVYPSKYYAKKYAKQYIQEYEASQIKKQMNNIIESDDSGSYSYYGGEYSYNNYN